MTPLDGTPIGGARQARALALALALARAVATDPRKHGLGANQDPTLRAKSTRIAT
ncbi:hypothetical protein GCM10023332_14830 [Luteimonas vadosa]|uniref:Uncharacterized protein n=1 Tax=Luteimonas vadosa TaxID=1165507 RepID=A0ABP9E442_9GAMM